MANNPQRSFAGGEIAPALHSRADLARYAIGLRTCRNMVVLRAGGASKRPGTKFVNVAGTAAAYTLTLTPSLTIVTAHNAGVVATLTDWLGNVIDAYAITLETDNAAIATAATTGFRTGTVTAVAGGTVNIRARIAALGLVSNNCVVNVSDYYILHTFVGDGSFNVTNGGTADRMVIVGGGGSAGSVDGSGVGPGGAGAGEFLRLDTPATQPELVLTPGSYPVVIGGGGPQQIADHSFAGGVFGSVTGASGTDTTFLGRRARGGGGGGGKDATIGRRGMDGGSGGGGAGCGDGTGGVGGATTHVLPGTGFPGGAGSLSAAIGAGGGGSFAAPVGMTGGAGTVDDISGIATTYAKGGDAGATGAAGGDGSGSGGSAYPEGLAHQGGRGGKGIAYIRYKASSGIVATGGTITTIPI